MDTTPLVNTGCSADTAYFVNDILPILQSNCAYSGCHDAISAKDGVILESYTSVINTADVDAFNADASSLYEVLNETNPNKIMPPPPNNTLTASQISAIALWINQGALNNACNSCDTTGVSFSSVVSPIITNSCQGCHGATSPSGGISLSNYTEIKSAALDGSLYGTINHENGYVAMPYLQSKLSQCKIDQIRVWIEEGALEN